MANIGLIGFGRVGRRLFREIHIRPRLGPVTAISEINPAGRDPAELTANLAYLLANDSAAGPFPGRVSARGNALLVDEREIPVFFCDRPQAVNWSGAGVRLLVEATGKEPLARQAAALAPNQLEKVVITRSSPAAQAVLVRGINLDTYDPASHHVISCSTCTANALAPVLKVMDDAFGVEQAALTSVHPALSGDTLLDSPSADFAAGRSGLGVRPVSSEMARTTAELLPRLKGRLTAMGLRVPTAVVNALLVHAVLARPPRTAGEAAEALKAAAQGPLKGVLALEEGFLGRPRVAVDFVNNPHSAVVDLNWLSLTGALLTLLIWHDNEYAYCCRVADTLEVIADRLAG